MVINGNKAVGIETIMKINEVMIHFSNKILLKYSIIGNYDPRMQIF